MIKQLRRKFIIISMSSVILVLLLIIGSINLSNYLNINKSISNRLQMIANNDGVFPSPQDQPPKDRKTTDAEAPFDTRYFTVLVNAEGSISDINTDQIFAIDSDTASEYALSLYTHNKQSGIIDNYKFQRYTRTASDGVISYLYVFVDCERELNTFKDFAFASAGISLVGLILVFLLVWFFSKQVTKPMVESYNKQKRFITDASHELKTPLTIIDANNEILEMTSGENEWTISTKKQVARLTSLTEKLVFLSRMDEENAKLEMINFSISDAILDTVEPYKSITQTKGKGLDIHVDSQIYYYGDEKTIRQLVSLLMDNAIKYSSEGGLIAVSLSTAGKNIIFSITNSVDQIEIGSHKELFERFYRSDSSHNSQTGGFGIGLSVAYAIVNAHKGKITATSSDSQSIKFTVTL